MKTLNLTIGQPRVANLGTDVAKYYLIADDRDVARIIPAAESAEWLQYDYTIAAAINVTRPTIMGGSLEEIEADIYSIIEDELVRAGIAETNDAGVLFIK